MTDLWFLLLWALLMAVWLPCVVLIPRVDMKLVRKVGKRLENFAFGILVNIVCGVLWVLGGIYKLPGGERIVFGMLFLPFFILYRIHLLLGGWGERATTEPMHKNSLA